MGRRCAVTISILLFCLLSGACSSRREHTISQDDGTTNSEVSSGKPEVSTVSPEVRAGNQDTGIVSPEEATGNQDDSMQSNRIGTELSQEEEKHLQSEGKEIEITADILTAYTDQEELIKALEEYPAGTGIKLSGAKKEMIDRLFYMEELSEETKSRINGKSYGDNCDLPYEELRYLRVLYHDFDDGTRIGELIVNRTIAQDILDIFRELYEIDYPIGRMVLIDEYDADDERSMSDNNSSAFNYRYIAGTTRLSKHSLGFAIDINPRYNPYITTIDGKQTILPENGTEYADRTKDCPYYIRKGDPCYEAFISRGFTWGGDWENSKDYQHFQKVVEC